MWGGATASSQRVQVSWSLVHERQDDGAVSVLHRRQERAEARG